MTDVVNKFIAILLIACMLLISPLVLMRKSDRVQNEMRALNAMEQFLDTIGDAHMIDSESYDRLTKVIESCSITADITISTYDITISEGKTYMWKTGIVSTIPASSPVLLDLGDVIELRVEEKTTIRSHDLWSTLFGSSTNLFDQTFVKIIK